MQKGMFYKLNHLAPGLPCNHTCTRVYILSHGLSEDLVKVWWWPLWDFMASFDAKDREICRECFTLLSPTVAEVFVAGALDCESSCKVETKSF